MGRSRLQNACAKLVKDRQGNFAIMTALLIPVLAAVLGAAVDTSTIVDHRFQLQDALDAAALSAAASLSAGHGDTTTAKTYAMNMLVTQMSNHLTAAEMADLKAKTSINITAVTKSGVKSYAITATGSFSFKLSGFASFMGFKNASVSSTSASLSQSETKNAMSMYLVLDRSGSMSFVTDTVASTTVKCQNYTTANWEYYPYLVTTRPCYVNKIAALKSAAASLFDELDTLEAVDTTDTLVRVGAVSFTDDMQTATPLAWGTTAVRSYVNALPAYPTGGTDMTDAMSKAYTSLAANTETTAQSAKGNTSFSKFIVLMTDGENTGASNTLNPLLDAQTLTTCTAARLAGITIYSVAFMAPTPGKTMLKACAGVPANYYEADDMDSLIKAFEEIGAKASKQTTRLTQ